MNLRRAALILVALSVLSGRPREAQAFSDSMLFVPIIVDGLGLAFGGIVLADVAANEQPAKGWRGAAFGSGLLCILVGAQQLATRSWDAPRWYYAWGAAGVAFGVANASLAVIGATMPWGRTNGDRRSAFLVTPIPGGAMASLGGSF